MSSGTRNLQITTRGNSQTLKPEPPADLWAQLEKHLSNDGALVPKRPEGAFTRREFSTKFGLSIDQAFRRLEKLRADGKVKMFGQGAATFYILL